MNMKKLAILALSLCMIAAIAVTGTIAYFTDHDQQTNVFTTGNVAIDLFEDFGDNKDNLEELIPVTYDPITKERREDNVIEKEVYVTNTGSEDAFVRVHIAIPTILDDGDPNFNASKNTLHFNYDPDSIGADGWDWSKVAKDEKYEGDWNFYTTEIAGVKYNVYVVTHEKAIVAGQTTGHAMNQVYLDKSVTNEQVANIKEAIGAEWKIWVVAEAAQAAGFKTAHEALNEAFGTPGAEGYVAPNFTAAPEGEFYKDI